jgi:hypothetical protein
VRQLLPAIISLILIAGCYGPQNLNSTQEIQSNPEIPPNFTTYTKENLFSISYPKELVIDSDMIEEVSGDIKEILKTTDPEISVEGVKFGLVGHIPIDENNAAFLLISFGPMPADMTLDEYMEGECQYERNHQMGFLIYSQTKTIIDGREAVILDYRTYDFDTGEERSLDLFTIEDGLLWNVSCSANPDGFINYEKTFYNILSSFRILTHSWSRWLYR